MEASQLSRLEQSLSDLSPAEKDQVCTADLGPRWMLVYSHGSDLTGVVVDDFGCQDVRLTDEPFTTAPGDAAQPGTVSGVLSGSLLDDLEVAGDQTSSSDSASAPAAPGIEVRAEMAVMLTQQPLGDVVVGELSSGDSIRATCIEVAAQTNAGYRGSAIRVQSGDLSGFAATTTLPSEGVDRWANFDMSTEQLAAQLDPC